jgi:hypothetical protein
MVEDFTRKDSMPAKRHNMLNHILLESVSHVSTWLHYFLHKGDNRIRKPSEFDSYGEYLIHLIYPKDPSVSLDYTAYTREELTKLGDATLHLLKEVAKDTSDPVLCRVKGRTTEYVTDCFALLEVLPVSDVNEAKDLLRSLRIDPRFDIKLDDVGNLHNWVDKALNGYYL